MQYSVLKEKGWLEKEVDSNLDLFAEIRKLKNEKNAIILAHYYQDSDIQDCADYIGDSLGLSQEAAKTDAAIIVFAGVHFMAETAKILSPAKKVLLPDLRAGCSLADSCPSKKFETFIKSHPEHIVISYVNCSAEVKALTDIVVTSSNAEKIVNSLPIDQKIIFAPDKNLGAWISKKTGRDMVLWNGACMVHELFSLSQLIRAKEKNPNALVIAHPECETAILEQANFIGSTTALLNYTIKSEVQEFIVVTEAGILHQMQKASPEKVFIPAAPATNCACNDCPHMKLNTLEKLYVCLKHEQPEISMPVELMNRARKPIVRMLELSAILVFCLLFRSMLFSQQQEAVQNGYTKFMYDNGTVSSEGTMKDGKPDGYWKTYFDNGKIKSEGNRKAFQLDSIWKFYNDQGILVLEYYYKNGKKNGARKNYDAKEKYLVSEENYINDVKQQNTYLYYKNGKTRQLIPFKDGREEGQGYEYDTIGTIITLIDYKAGFVKRQEKINRRDKDGLKQNVWKEFYPNGNLKNECTWLNGIQNGYLKEYSLNGNLQNTTKYVDGKLITDAPELAKLDTKIEYYEGGIIKSSGTSKNGIPEGAYREYSMDGKVTAAKIYKEGFLIGEGIYDEFNKEQGPWKEYHPNGQLKGQGEYKDGKRIGEWVFYYPNGKLEQKGKYDKKGLAQNEWKWYYDTGKLLREEIYLNDVLDGPTTEYDEEGKVITKGQYVDGMKEDEWEYELGDYKETGKYKADRRDGVWKHFYTPSGKIRFEGNFVDGNQDGKHVYYYQNGKISEQGKYIVGRKEGNWEYFDEEGVKLLTILYQDDVELKFDGVKVKPTQEETDKPDKK